MRESIRRRGRLLTSSPPAIRAQRLIAADAEALFLFLVDLESQAVLAGRYLEVVGLDGTAGARDGVEVLIRNPLGRRRRAQVRLLVTLPSRLVLARADIGGRTVALISWTLTERRGTVHVELAIVIQSAPLFERLILQLGRRRLIERRLERTLAALAELAVIVAEFITVDGADHASELPRRAR